MDKKIENNNLKIDKSARIFIKWYKNLNFMIN